jgi:hypothetical protein
MLLIREEAVDRMRRDHDAMLDLIRRIQALCSERDRGDDCRCCGDDRRAFCRSHVEQLVRAFVEATLKHNAMESLYMDDGVPELHRRAHNRAHMAIAEQLKSIRIVLASDGNTVRAIEGIDEVLAALSSHFVEFDGHLQRYLMVPAA